MRSVSQQTTSENSSEMETPASVVNQTKPIVSNQLVQENQSNERIESFQNAAQDLGSVDGIQGATSSVGSLIDALVPRDGDSANLSINFNIPVHPLVKITISLTGWAGRFNGNVILNSSLNVGAKLEGKVKAAWLELQAYLAVSGMGYIKTMGNSGAEAFEFMGLGVHEIIAKHSEKIAALMMGDEERSEIISHMDGGEYAELGLGVSVSAGVSLDDGGDDDNVIQGANASAGYTKGIKFTDQNNDGQLEQQDVAKASGSVSLNLDLGKYGLSDFAGSTGMSVDVFYANDEVSKIITNLEFSASVQPKTFGLGFLAECFSGIAMEMINIFRNGADHYEGSAGVRFGKIADSMSRLSIADNIASRLINENSENLPGNPAVKSKTKFCVGMFWQSNGSGNVNFKLVSSKSSSINIGVASVEAGVDDTMFLHRIPFQTD